MCNEISSIEREINKVCRLYELCEIDKEEKIKRLSYLMTCYAFLKHAPIEETEDQKVKTR